MESKQEIREKLITALRDILSTGSSFSDRHIELYLENATDMTFDECVDSIYKTANDTVSVDAIIRAMKIYVLS